MGLVLHIRCKRTECKDKTKEWMHAAKKKRPGKDRRNQFFFIKKPLWNTRERESERTNLEGIEMDPGISANTHLIRRAFLVSFSLASLQQSLVKTTENFAVNKTGPLQNVFANKSITIPPAIGCERRSATTIIDRHN